MRRSLPTLPKGPAGAAVRAVALAAAVAAVMYAASGWIAGWRVPYVLYFAIVLAAELGRRLADGLKPPVTGQAPVREDSEARVFGMLPDRPFTEARRWEDRLELIRGDPGYFGRTVLPAVGTVVDDRLRITYGITRASDPDRAREVMGERLWQFLATDRPRRAPTPGDLDVVLVEMEELWAVRR